MKWNRLLHLIIQYDNNDSDDDTHDNGNSFPNFKVPITVNPFNITELLKSLNCALANRK
jgi:hypothetical protein